MARPKIARLSHAKIGGRKVEERTQPAGEPGGQPMPAVQGYLRMLAEVRSWGRWLLVLGFAHFVGAQFLDVSWGVVLVLVGLASFYFLDVAMFPVYGTTLAWAAIANFIAGSAGWRLFSLVQVLFAYRTFRAYSHFRPIQAAFAALSPEERQGHALTSRAARLFPWTSFVLGAVTAFGTLLVFGGMVLAAFQGRPDPTEGYVTSLLFAVSLGVLGLAFGIAALLGRLRPWPVALAGTVFSLVPVLFLLAAVLL